MHGYGLRRQLAAAARLAGLILSLVLLACVATAATLALTGTGPGALAWLPDCPAAQAGQSCAACGMTRGFISVAGGDIHTARSHNPAAPPLFALACIAAALGGGFASRAALARLRAASRRTPEG